MRVPTHVLRETISVEAFDGAGSRGPTYATAVSMRALMQPTRRTLMDDTDNVVTIDVVMIVRPESGPIASQSRVTWDGTTYRVVEGYFYPDTRRPVMWQGKLTRLES